MHVGGVVWRVCWLWIYWGIPCIYEWYCYVDN